MYKQYGVCMGLMEQRPNDITGRWQSVCVSQKPHARENKEKKEVQAVVGC